MGILSWFRTRITMKGMVSCPPCQPRRHCGAWWLTKSRSTSQLTGAPRSHLAISDEDPSVGDKFSTSSRRFAGQGASRSLPAAVHGAPSTVQESREALSRLKRMQGFESQDFDAVVRMDSRSSSHMMMPCNHRRRTMWSVRCKSIEACTTTTWRIFGSGRLPCASASSWASWPS